MEENLFRTSKEICGRVRSKELEGIRLGNGSIIYRHAPDVYIFKNPLQRYVKLL
jgi:hypothetical protein